MSQPQREDVALRRDSSCRYRLLQMSRLIKGSSIRLREKSPPPAPSMLLRGGPRVKEGSSPLLTLAGIHPPCTPHDSRHKCLWAPHLQRTERARSSDSKMGLQHFNPLQPVKPSTLTSICQERCWSSRGGDGLFGWVGGGGGASLVPSRRIF